MGPLKNWLVGPWKAGWWAPGRLVGGSLIPGTDRLHKPASGPPERLAGGPTDRLAGGPTKILACRAPGRLVVSPSPGRLVGGPCKAGWWPLKGWLVGPWKAGWWTPWKAGWSAPGRLVGGPSFQAHTYFTNRSEPVEGLLVGPTPARLTGEPSGRLASVLPGSLAGGHLEG